MLEQTVLNGRYQLQQRLGIGGMAMVYKAHDLTLERTVAIKILRKDLTHDAEFRKRFHQEAKAAARLSHPNIVTIHDFGVFEDQIFIVMEFVGGADLKSLLKEREVFTLPEAVELMAQACYGIGYAHRSGLVHCDIKPHNMLVTPDSHLKVVDFGIARALSSISPDEHSDVVWGSPQYFSPEQAAGAAPSPASDVYSLGVVLFELITGRLPFNATTAEELARQHRESLAPSPRRINPRVPPALEQIVLKVLSKEPSSRYRTADQLGRVLTALGQELQPSDQPAAGATASGSILPTAVPPPVVAPSLPAPSQTVSERRRLERPPSGPTILAGGNLPRGETPGEAVVIQVEPAPELVVVSPKGRAGGFDFLTWLLALLAAIALGGLVPFWLWVLYKLNPPA